MTYQNKTVKKHKRGNWFARIWYDGKATSIYGRTKQECYDKLKATVDKIEQARAEQNALKLLEKVESIATKYSVPSVIKTAPQVTAEPVKTYTFREWFEEWLNGYKAGSLRATSIKGYQSMFKHFAELHDMKLTEITNIMLVKVLNTKQLCRQHKDGMKSMLKQMFALAHNDKFIDSNPTLNLPRPKATPPVRERRAMTPEQEQAFIETAMTDLDKYEPFLICLLQGVRRGEMLALRPNDFDFERNTLRIDESYDQANPTDLQTKNQDSNRTMPMFELTRKLLIKYKDQDPTKRIYEKFNSAKIKTCFTELLEKAKLPKFVIHELRHTFITRCSEKKIDEIIVQRWVGHQIGSRMTKAVYTHISNNKEQEFIELVNAKAS
jgi:integrase